MGSLPYKAYCLANNITSETKLKGRWDFKLNERCKMIDLVGFRS
jgi:hypothetical protein